MKAYQKLELQILRIESEDVLTGSYELPEVEIFSRNIFSV